VGPDRKEYVLFREIREKLKATLAEMEERFKGTLSDTELAELKSLDEFFMADPDTNALRYDTRWSLYDASVKASPPLNYAQTLNLVGEDWQPLRELLARVDEIRKQVQSYRGTLSEKALTITGYCFARAERVHSDEFCKVYLTLARTTLAPQLKFPLIGPTSDFGQPLRPDALVPAVQLVDRIKHELDSPTFQKIVSSQKQPLISFRSNLTKLDPVTQALVTPEKHLRLVTVVLLGRAEQFRLSGQQIGMDLFKAMELRVGTIDHATPIKVGTAGQVSTEAGADLELAKFTMYEPFHFHFFRALGDRNIAVDMPAPTDWTSIRLLDQQRARRIDDGRRWQFALSPARGKLIWFEFRFEAPLPELDDWPMAASIGLQPPRR
jgi:hypothetical protein